MQRGTSNLEPSPKVESDSVSERAKRKHKNILEQTTHTKGKEVSLEFTWDPHNPAHNHNEAILFIDTPAERCRED